MTPVFFTADEHYGHVNIINFCKRPFDNVDDMRESLIANHNLYVPKNAETYHLGDIFWRHTSVEQAANILKRLNGKHFLIWGNHDETAKKLMESEYLWVENSPRFVWAKDVHMLRRDGIHVWLSHYAHRVYPDSHKGAYHLYGHTHAVLPDFRWSMDVGVDAQDYRPISLEEVDAKMKLRFVKPDEVMIDMAKNRWDKVGN